MVFKFYKAHGAGNDFIVIDNREKFFPVDDNAFIRNLCAQHTGIGADGLLLIENSQRADFRMRFFNSDGYESDMCANGSRCICYIAFLLGVVDKTHSFETGDGVHSGEVLENGQVKIDVKYHKNRESRKFPDSFELPGSISFVDFLNTGVPHVVLLCEDVGIAPVVTLGRNIRSHPYYQPEGTNVNFVQFSDRGPDLIVRTFERGVEAETLSCGSGVTASVIAIADRFDKKSGRFSVRTNGGVLKVFMDEGKDAIFLEGPVRVIYKGKYMEEDIS